MNGAQEIRRPYLLLVGDVDDPIQAKTAFGIKDWVPEACLGQLRFNGQAVDLRLADMLPREAAARGAKTLVVGIAPPGGRLPASWHSVLLESLEAGLDLAAGLHQRLKDIPQLVDCARRLGRHLHDVRHCDRSFPVGTGVRRPGRRLLTVGTDCAVGKKYTALAIAKAMAERGHRVDFRATGQTGILISGSGIAVDAVIADFVSGAAEALSPANTSDHWDIIEGQGSLFHPSYAAVTLGLVHGSQADALVLCHNPVRKTLASLPNVPMNSLEQAIPAYLAAGRMTNEHVRLVGISLNTSSLSAEGAADVLSRTSERLNLLCVDPIRTGVEPLVRAVEELYGH